MSLITPLLFTLPSPRLGKSTLIEDKLDSSVWSKNHLLVGVLMCCVILHRKCRIWPVALLFGMLYAWNIRHVSNSWNGCCMHSVSLISFLNRAMGNTKRVKCNVKSLVLDTVVLLVGAFLVHNWIIKCTTFLHWTGITLDCSWDLWLKTPFYKASSFSVLSTYMWHFLSPSLFLIHSSCPHSFWILNIMCHMETNHRVSNSVIRCNPGVFAVIVLNFVSWPVWVS